METSVNNNLSLDAIARDYGRMVSSICRRMITDEETARDNLAFAVKDADPVVPMSSAVWPGFGKSRKANLGSVV